MAKVVDFLDLLFLEPQDSTTRLLQQLIIISADTVFEVYANSRINHKQPQGIDNSGKAGRCAAPDGLRIFAEQEADGMYRRRLLNRVIAEWRARARLVPSGKDIYITLLA